MPTEHRLVAAFILLVAAAIVALALGSTVDRIAIASLAALLVGAGLVLPAPRLANALAAVSTGSLVAACAMGGGASGATALVVPAMASSVLLLGAGGVGWGLALPLLWLVIIGVDPLAMPASRGTALDVFAVTLLGAWCAWVVLAGVRLLTRGQRSGLLVTAMGAIGAASLIAIPTGGAALVVGSLVWLAIAHAYADSRDLGVPARESAAGRPVTSIVVHG